MYHSGSILDIHKQRSLFVCLFLHLSYRLAPRHTFPVQFHECYAVVTSVLENADHYGIDKNHLVIAGDSSGGNLAAAVVLKLRDENKKVAAQVRNSS